MAPHSEKLKLMRVVIREDFTKARCDQLIFDIRQTLAALDSMAKVEIEKHEELVKRTVTHHGKNRNQNKHYKGEKHTLAKHGKTQPIC